MSEKKPIRILFVEDYEPDIKLILREINKGLFFPDYKSIQSLPELEYEINNNTYDLVITDFNVISFDAFAVLSYLQNSNINTPVIIVSGTVGEETAAELMRSGAKDYILKDNLKRLNMIIEREIKDYEQKKLIKKELYESENRFINSFNHSTLGMSKLTISGKFLQVNNSFCKMFGYSETELLNMEFSKITYPDDIILSFNQLDNLIKGQVKCQEFEKRYIHKSGEIIHARIITTLNIGEDGRPLYLYSQTEDITDRKKSEIKLREQAALLDKAKDAIIVIDTERIITYWNRSAELLYGWTAKEVIGQIIDSFIYEDNINEIYETLFSEGEWKGEITKKNKDGKKIIIECNKTLILNDDGSPKSILIFNTDITEKKAIESQFLRSQRLESIGTLASGIAHDLNNILSPIMTSIELFKLNLSHDKKMSIINHLETNVKKGAELIKQVLLFSKGVEIKSQLLNINLLLIELEYIIKETFTREIQVIIKSPPELWHVVGDKTQIFQLLMNLCINARDAMPVGGKLSIETENIIIEPLYTRIHLDAKPGSYILIKISDTGLGMSKEILERIFEPFFTTKESGKGTGLGLSTSHQIIKSHKGFINTYSEEDRGSVFNVYIPAMPGDIAYDVQQLNIESIRGNGELILVIDDEESIRDTTQTMLEEFGYKVITANDGTEAMAVYFQFKDQIKVVLTDMMMPYMDGLAIIKALLSIDPEIKIIAASGLPSSADEIKAKALGIRYFLAKPYTAGKLLELIHNLLTH